MRDIEKKGRYVTIDRWRSQKDFETFKNKWISEYGAIDRRCEVLTESEQFLGFFEDPFY